jgi:serine/threonine protein kinase
VPTQIVLALSECHSKKKGAVLHRDIKPSNIFLDHNKNVKLGDYGLARVLKHSLDYAKTHLGTPYYMSPEQVGEDRYNDKSDIW